MMDGENGLIMVWGLGMGRGWVVIGRVRLGCLGWLSWDDVCVMM